MRNNRIAKRIFLLVMCAVMCLTFSLSGYSVKAATTVNNKLAQMREELSSLQNSLSTSRGNKATLLEKLNESKENLNELLAEKMRLEIDLTYTAEEIELISKLINQYGEISKELKSEVEELEKELEVCLDDFGKMLRYMYMYEDESVLEILFASEDFGDFLARLDYINNMIEYNDKLVDKIQKTRDEKDLLQSEYDKSQTSLKEYGGALETKSVEYSTKAAELQILAEDIEEGIKLTQTQYDLLLQEEKDLLSEITKVQQQIQELEYYSEGEFSWPFASNVSYYISSRFGLRTDGPFVATEYHKGIDIVAAHGTAIRAVASGIVTRSEYYGANGNIIVIDHGGGLSTLYCHCSTLLLKTGAKVVKDQVIAKVGSTGQSSGAHLHFAVIYNGKYVNPEDYLPKAYV